MTKIPVRAFHVDEIKACFQRKFARFNKVSDDFFDFVVSKNVRRVAMKFFVEQRVLICSVRIKSFVVRRFDKPSGMRELQPHIGRSVGPEKIARPRDCFLAQLRDFADGLACYRHLPRVSFRRRHNGDGLAAEEYARAAPCASEPTTTRQFAWRAVRKAVPTFHRQKSPTGWEIDGPPRYFALISARLGKHRIRADSRPVDEVEFSPDFPQISPKFRRILERGDLFKICHFYLSYT